MVWLAEHPRSIPPHSASRTCSTPLSMFATGAAGSSLSRPGQRVAMYARSKRRRPDVRAYVAGLEAWIIRTLEAFNVRASGARMSRCLGETGRQGTGFEDKVAALGVRLRRWVSFHGISINVEPDLTHFAAIVPCGVVDPLWRDQPRRFGHPVTMADVDVALRQAFEEVLARASAPAGGDDLTILPRCGGLLPKAGSDAHPPQFQIRSSTARLTVSAFAPSPASDS